MSMMYEVERQQRRRSQAHGVSAMVVAIILVAVPASRAAAIFMTMEASKTESGTAKLCVGLDSGGQKVAGTQNDLIWDAACAKLKPSSCAAIPDSKKPLHGNTPANLQSTYRALVFALDNVDPIRDGPLYCCEFELTGSDACCAVRFDRLGASDPGGTALSTSGNPEKLCLASGVAASGAPPAAPPAPAPKEPPGGGQWLWVVLIGAVVVVVAVLIVRGRSTT